MARIKLKYATPRVFNIDESRRRVRPLSAEIGTYACDMISITFSEPLYNYSVPLPSAFTIALSGGPAVVDTITVFGGAGVVLLNLDRSIVLGETGTVTYTPGIGPLQSTDRTRDVENFTIAVTIASSCTTTTTEWDNSFTFILDATGTGAGVSTLKMEVTEDVIVTLDGTARFYSDAAGTLNESTAWNLTAGALRTIYIRCPSGSSNMVVSDGSKLKGIGGPGLSGYGWISQTNAANITFTPAGLVALENLGAVIGNMVISGALPDSLKKIYVSSNSFYWNYTGPVPDGMTILALSGSNINWTYAGELPSGLTVLSLGDSCYWTYTGALPVGLTLLQFQCPTNNSVHWTYNGSLPVGLTYLMLDSTNISWTYNGALPTGLTSVYLAHNGIHWTYNGALPVGLASIVFDGSSIDWTGLDVGDTGNFTNLTMYDFRQAKMSSADMITLLTQMTTRTGTMPTSVVINDYADYAAPPAGVVTAVNTLKATKSIVSVILGA